MTRSQLEDDFESFWEQYGPTGYQLAPEHPFTPTVWSDAEGWQTRRWRFDFALVSHKIAIELEGMGLGHQSNASMRQDMQKYNLATSHGWRVLRFDSVTLRSWPMSVAEIIEATILAVEEMLGEHNETVHVASCGDFDIVHDGEFVAIADQ